MKHLELSNSVSVVSLGPSRWVFTRLLISADVSQVLSSKQCGGRMAGLSCDWMAVYAGWKALDSWSSFFFVWTCGVPLE